MTFFLAKRIGNAHTCSSISFEIISYMPLYSNALTGALEAFSVEVVRLTTLVVLINGLIDSIVQT